MAARVIFEGPFRLPHVLALSLLIGTGGCAPLLGQITNPVQPGGVAEYVGELRNAKDVQGKGFWFKRAIKAVVGIDDREKALLLPNGVHVDGRGRVLVADTRARVVHVFDRQRRRYQALHASDSDPFLAPIAVTTDASARIYVSDSVRSRIFVFSPDGKFLRTLGGLGREESIFQRATGIAIDRKRERLYVVDTAAMRVVVLSLDGRELLRIGARGTGPGEFNFPTHIALAPDGSFWVADSLNFRVQHFDPEGVFLGSFGKHGDMPGNFEVPKGVAVDNEGRVLVVEGRADRVQAFDSTGRLLFVFGQTGNQPGDLFLPTGISFDGASRQLFVADSYNGRVEIFRLRTESHAPAGGN